MADRDFVRSMLSLIDTYYELKRSRTLLKAFWNEFDNFSLKELSEEKSEQLNNLVYLLDVYETVSSQRLEEMEEIVNDSIERIERLREAGEFSTQHE
jgi:hypothetical protein